MKNKKNYLLLVLLSIIIQYSCDKSDSISKDYETFAEFHTSKKYNINKFTDKKYMMPPIDMEIIDDKYLITENGQGVSKPMILIYDLESKIFYKGFGKEGKGPNEFINIRGIFVNNNNLWVYDKTQTKFKIYRIDDILYKSKPEPKLIKKLNMNEGWIWKLNIIKNKIVTTGAFIDYRLVFYNFDLEPIKKIGEFPENTSEKNKFIHFQTTNIVKNPKKELFSFANLHNDMFEIYNYNGELLKTICGPDIFKFSWLTGRQFKNTIFTYSRLGATSNHIYAVYSGLKMNNKKDWLSVRGKNIFVFDWDGKPVKKIVTDFHILSIIASEKRKELYMIYFDGEYFRIGYIDISDIEGK